MKSSVLISICLLLHALIQIEGQIQTSTCGRVDTKNVTPLILNGHSSNHYWPWHAAIYHRTGKGPTYKCGGSVISTRSVLTAAHCVSYENAELDVQLVTVALGRFNLARNETSAQWFEVSEIIMHPDYNSIDFANDIAIIALSASAIFNNYVQPICLWRSKIDVSEVVGKKGTVIGWGITETGVMSNVLQEAKFPVVDVYTCLMSNPHFFAPILRQTNFCAGHRNGTSLCQGDSGGSITFEDNGIFYIRGIVSIGQLKRNTITQVMECDLTQYAVFTDVAQFLPWIIETTTAQSELSALISRRPIADSLTTDSLICGRLPPRATPLITYSYDAHHWPWHAAIYHKVNGFDIAYRCGGTVINSKAILTAAHCVQIDANKISVSLGRLNLDVDENSAQTFGVAEVITHPEFDLERNANDIAIVKFSTDATFNRYVRPACLWKSSNTDFSEIDGRSGTIVGWGQTETGEMSNVLQEAMAPVVSRIDCLQSNRDFFGRFLTETNFCAGHRNGTGVCRGDTGGSMTFEQNGVYYIRGIASIGPANIDPATGQIITCDSTQFTIFTDVAKYLQWIKDNQ